MAKSVIEEQRTLETGAASAAPQPKLKNLATAKPREFFAQANKIRKAVEKWMTATEISKIRAKAAEVVPIGDDLPDEEKEKLKEQNRNAMQEQAMKNFNEILDSMLETHLDETLEVLALACFVDPKDVDDHTVSEYIGALNEILSDPNVLGFFTSLIRLEHRSGLNV